MVAGSSMAWLEIALARQRLPCARRAPHKHQVALVGTERLDLQANVVHATAQSLTN